ncbi:MAG TPA: undecaprenyl-diphosphate phosphatase [Chthoniobacteraceae bacterium]
MPPWLEAVLLGFIEGLTEFIPVSSTGHLLIVEHWLGHQQSDLFNIVIQCGAVLAVIPLFWGRLAMLSRWRESESRTLIAKILLAFFITGVGGLILDKMDFKLPETVHPVAWALVIGGVLFIAVEKWLRGRTTNEQITWAVVIAVAVGQLLAAIFPGLSRSGSTILLALMLGTNRVAATEFSFLVGIPTLLAAGSLKIFKAFRQPAPDAVPEDWTLLLIAAVVSAIVSFVAVKWLLRFVQSHTFVGFGVYRIVLGVLLLLFFRHAIPVAP